VGTGQTIMKQLEAMQKNGKKVLGGTNADFFNTTTYIPYGVCYRDGVAVKTSFSRTDCNVFVITKDNEACCFTEEEYALHKDIVREAVCGRSTLLLKNGEQLDQSGNTMPVAKMEPRTAIGVSQDGKEVYLMVVDGRNFYYSNGADLLDLMNLMSACGRAQPRRRRLVDLHRSRRRGGRTQTAELADRPGRGHAQGGDRTGDC